MKSYDDIESVSISVYCDVEKVCILLGLLTVWSCIQKDPPSEQAEATQ